MPPPEEPEPDDPPVPVPDDGVVPLGLVVVDLDLEDPEVDPDDERDEDDPDDEDEPDLDDELFQGSGTALAFGSLVGSENWRTGAPSRTVDM